MGRITENFEIEGAFATAQLVAQWREARPIDLSRAQDKPPGAFLKFNPVAGFNTQCLKNPRGKCDLALGGNLDEHDGGLLVLYLTHTLYW
jgi:hypothetical protein